jgi:hypothetical protein
MYELFCSQFENVPREQFYADLDEKNWVMLLQDDGKVVGFSTLDVYETTINDQQMTLVYSGDTAVDRETWSDSALSYHLMGAFGWLRHHYSCDHLYWFLLVSGYRTYRLLPVFSDVFYPRYDRATPADVQALMDGMAAQRFGANYDPASGIVRLENPSILREGYRGIPENRLSDPDIAFFAERNPGHLQGDELVCFCELAEDKLTRIGKRLWRKGQKLFPVDE